MTSLYLQLVFDWLLVSVFYNSTWKYSAVPAAPKVILWPTFGLTVLGLSCFQNWPRLFLFSYMIKYFQCVLLKQKEKFRKRQLKLKKSYKRKDWMTTLVVFQTFLRCTWKPKLFYTPYWWQCVSTHTHGHFSAVSHSVFSSQSMVMVGNGSNDWLKSNNSYLPLFYLCQSGGKFKGNLL